MFRQDVAAERDRHARQPRSQNLAGTLFVRRILKREEENDGDAFDLFFAQPRRDLCQGGFVEGAQHAALGVEAFRYLVTQGGGDERRGAVLAEAVEVRAVLAADDEDVGKTFGGEEGRAGTQPLQQGVGGYRGAVDHRRCLAHPQVRQPGHDGAALVAGRRGRFVDAQPAVHQPHEIGERAADVDADQLSLQWRGRWHNQDLSLRLLVSTAPRFSFHSGTRPPATKKSSCRQAQSTSTKPARSMALRWRKRPSVPT